MSFPATLRHALTICLLLAAAAGQAAPSLVGTGTQASSSPTTSVTLAAPAGLAAGDLMLTILVARTANLPLDQQLSSVPSGWTLVRSQDDGSAMGLAIYRKLATASEPASYSWTLASGARVAAALQAFRGVDSATPVEASSSQANAASSTYTAPSVTTSTANALIVSFHAAADGNGSVANPSGMTQAVNLATGAGPNGLVLGSSYVAQAAAGASGNKLSTGNASLTSLGALVALRSGPLATLTSGTRYSFESYDVPGSYIRHSNFLGYIAPVSASSDSTTINDSTFIARPGLTNSACWSFESVNYPGYYLRHNNFVLKLNTYSATAPYPADATFCLRSGLADAAAISFEATNYAGYYLQHKVDTSMILATTDGTAAVNGRATFYPRAGWASTVDHYELSVPTASLTCTPTTVTVKACATNASTCSIATSVNGSVVLSTTAGTLGTSLLSFASGIATTTLSLPGGADNTAAALSLSAASTQAANADRCCPNGSSCAAASSCATTFNRAGFIIATSPSTASSAGGAAVTPATQTAGTASGDYYLRAVRTNSSTQACEAAVTGSRNVSWAYRCNDPATCSGSNLMTINAGTPTVIQRNNTGAAATFTAVPMSFDAYGNAKFNFTFADVGQLTLLTSLSISVGTAGSDTLSGSSTAFVTKPAGFTVTNIANATSPFAANPGATDHNGAAFVAAGAPFKARITAVTAGGAATPNFGRESVPEGVLLTPTLVEPAGGTTGSIGNASVGGAQFSSGLADVVNLSYSEVGIMKLTPALASGNYLGSGSVSGTPTGPLGRFIPAGFTVAAQLPTHRSAMAPACVPASTFTYLDEDFQLAFKLTAVNAANAQTLNYTGNYAKLDLTDRTRFKLAGISGATLFKTTDRLSVSASAGLWQNGVANPVTLTARVARAAAPDGPFSATKFGVAPLDTDAVGLLSADLDSDPSVAGNETAQVGQIPLRYGRLRLQNGMSAADRVLRLPLTAQYWDSAASPPSFKTNDLDSCTRVTADNLSFGNFRKTLAAGDIVMSPATATVNGAQPSFLTFAKPANGGVGSVDVAVSLGQAAADNSCLKTATAWVPAKVATAGASVAGLRGAWCGSTATSDPSARATWGLYRGSDGIVFQRENY